MAQQNTLDFLIAAHVSGQEQMAKLINTVGSLQKETERLKTANAGLSASTDTVIRNGTRYNNALDAQSKQLRNARQGTQQLGMQINDFATSVSTGASVSQAFNQQLGQLGIAMSMMGGKAGAVGAFLAGPWGAAITLAVVALGPFIDKLGQTIMKLFDTETALDRVSKKSVESMAALKNSLNQASLQSTAMTDVAMKAALSSRALTKAQQDLNALQAAGPPIGADSGVAIGMYYRRLGAAQAQVAKLTSEVRKFDDEVAEIGMIRRVRGMQAVATAAQNTAPSSITASAGGGGSAAISEIQNDAKKAQEAAARYYANLKGEFVPEYQGYRTMMIKSDEVWADNLSKIEDEMSRNSIDAAAQRAKGIGYISEKNAEKIAKDVDIPMAELKRSIESIGASVSDAFKGMVTGATSWKDAMRGIISSVIDELWRLYVVQQIVGLVSSVFNPLKASAAANIAANPDLFANGTVNAPGGMAWVGERGPELVNLPRGSQVIPAHRAQSMGGGGVTVNVDARGSADPAAVRAQVEQGILQAAPAIIAAAQSRTVNSLRRPRLGGAMQ